MSSISSSIVISNCCTAAGACPVFGPEGGGGGGPLLEEAVLYSPGVGGFCGRCPLEEAPVKNLGFDGGWGAGGGGGGAPGDVDDWNWFGSLCSACVAFSTVIVFVGLSETILVISIC